MLFIKVIAVLVLAFLFVLWILGVISQFLMIRNRKPGIKLFDKRILFNPFNVEFSKEYLTEKGIYWRNKSWLCFGIFAVAIVIILSLKIIFPL